MAALKSDKQMVTFDAAVPLGTSGSYSKGLARPSNSNRASGTAVAATTAEHRASWTQIQPVAKPFHIFLSYRVSTDAAIAELIHDKLLSLGYQCWWDRTCLETGTQWQQGFVQGLSDSACFVPILSPAALKIMSALTPDSPTDNVLLEHVLALECASRLLAHVP